MAPRVTTVGCLAIAVGCSLACGGGPGSTRQGRLVDGWLDAVQAREDGDALAYLALPHDVPVPFGPERFGKRADRLHLLRDHDRREITSVARVPSTYRRPNDPLGEWVVRALQRLDPTYVVQGVLREGDASADLALQVRRGRLHEITVDGVRLIPRVTYEVIELPPPLQEPPKLRGTEVGWRTWGGGTFVEVAGELDSPVPNPGLLLTTTCREGDRGYRHATMSGHGDAGTIGWRPFSLSDHVGPEAPDAARPASCEVTLRVSDGDRRDATWCLDDDEATPGPCPEAPVPRRTGPDPVTVDEVSVSVSGRGATVSYTLHPNDPMPPRYNTPDGAWIRTEVACAAGALDAHHRPLNDEEDRPGVHRRYGSVLLTTDAALVPPCAVRLRYVRDDGYDRQDVLAWEGCFDGAETRSPCP